MTTITLKKSRGQIKAVDVTGHAGYADEGHDIVCAAVTSAVQLIHIFLDDVLLMDVDTAVDARDASIRFILPDGLNAEDSRAAQNALKAFRLHMQQLVKEHGQYMQVMEVQYDA